MKGWIIILAFLFLPATTFAATFATWNPSDKSASITLSNANLTESSTVTAAVRSTISESTGKWYWEQHVDADGGNTILLGVSDSSATLTNWCGSDVHGWGYYDGGAIYHSGSAIQTGLATYTTGDVIGIAYDAGAGTVQFYKNNVAVGTAVTVSGTLFACASSAGGTQTITANFGASTLTYAPPTGFNAGLYTGTLSSPTSIVGLVRALWL